MKGLFGINGHPVFTASGRNDQLGHGHTVIHSAGYMRFIDFVEIPGINGLPECCSFNPT